MIKRQNFYERIFGKPREREVSETERRAVEKAGSSEVTLEGEIQNLLYNDLGKQVLEARNKEFKGVKNIEDLTEYEDNAPIQYSNLPRALHDNLYLLKNSNVGLLTWKEVIQNWDNIPERDNTYAETNTLIIYPNEGPNEDRRQEALKLIGKSEITIPHILENVGVKKADNDQGFTLTGSDLLKYEEAPLFTKDCKIEYNGTDLEESGDSGIQIYVPNDQSGLRRVCRYRSGGIDAWSDYLLLSYGSGRVQFLAPKGHA